MEFEGTYLKAREIEGRLLDDETVRLLPYIPKKNPQYTEWKHRRNSCFLVGEYLQKKNFKSALDLGCGNGWMSNYYAEILDSVIGMDINSTEIEQAKRVFTKDNLSFKCDDIYKIKTLGKFDCIIISAAIQYFKDPSHLLHYLMEYHLNKKGRIIVMDTFFYANAEIKDAKIRSEKYYKKINCSEMTEYYFHHSQDIFSDFRVEFVYIPKKKRLTDFIYKRNSLTPFTIYSIAN